MNYFLLLLLVGLSLFGEDKVESFIVHQPKEDRDSSSNIRKAELLLNQNITKANLSLSEYASLLSMKTSSLPHKTIFSRGIAKGEDCILNKNQQETADCIKVEQFDFVEGDTVNKGVAVGSKVKSMILFFSSRIGEKADTLDLANVRLVRVKSRIFVHNLSTLDKKLIEVIDTDPLGNPDHDDKIFITSHTDAYFASSKKDAEENGTPYKYTLSSLENTKANPIRNQFKREAYIKHLMAFEKILSKVHGYNEVEANPKESNKKEIPKKTLKN